MVAAHRRTRHRARVLGPVLSVFAVLAVTAPATWLTLRTDHGSRLADALPEHSVSTRADEAGAASRGGARPSITAAPSNKSGLQGRTHRSRTTTAPSTTASTAPTGKVTTLQPTTVPSAPKPSVTPTTTKPTTTKPTTTVPKPPPSTTTAPPSGDSPSEYETEVVRLTNNERAKAGCGPLTIDSSLTKSSGGHAEDMVDRHFFDHTNPDGKDPFERMADAGFHGSAMAENIAMGYANPQAAVTGWMNSSGHRRNILNCGYNRIGVGYDPGQILDGYSKGSWVQNFGTK